MLHCLLVISSCGSSAASFVIVTSCTWLSAMPAPVIRTNFGLVRISSIVTAAGVAHRSPHATDKLMHDGDHDALVRDPTLNTFRHEFLKFFGGILEITVR